MAEAGKRRANRLRTELASCHRQSARLLSPAFPNDRLDHLQNFQRNRLAATYADLSAQARYAPATDFFLAELYGGRDMGARDAQLTRALPILEKTLPSRLRHALADAFRLQSLSLELDIALAETMEHQAIDRLDATAYQWIYPTVPRALREEQIDLIYRLALELDRAVRLPLVMGLIRAMRGPAKAAGFAELQSFLERGLGAFGAMKGAQTFAETIRDREHQVMEKLYAGDPEPFALGPI